MPGLASEAQVVAEACLPAWVLLVMFLGATAPRVAEKLLDSSG